MLYSPKYFFGPHASAQRGRFSCGAQKKRPLRNRLPASVSLRSVARTHRM